MSDEQTQTPIKDALAKLDASPITGTAELGVVVSRDGGAGVAATVSTTLGKGWTLNGKGQWQHKTGWQMSAVARWTKGK